MVEYGFHLMTSGTSRKIGVYGQCFRVRWTCYGTVADAKYWTIKIYQGGSSSPAGAGIKFFKWIYMSSGAAAGTQMSAASGYEDVNFPLDKDDEVVILTDAGSYQVYLWIDIRKTSESKLRQFEDGLSGINSYST